MFTLTTALLATLLSAVLCYVSYHVYRHFQLPECFRSFHQIPSFALYGKILQGYNYIYLWEHILKGPLKSFQSIAFHGYFGWQLHVADSQLLKFITSEIRIIFSILAKFHLLDVFHMQGPFSFNPGGFLHRFTKGSLAQKNGKEWAINRGFWNNAFKRLKPTRKVGICVADAITYVIGRSDKGVIVDMEDFTKRLVTEVLGKVLFDYQVGVLKDRNSPIGKTLRTVNSSIMKAFYYFACFLDRPWWRRHEFQQIENCESLWLDLIAEKREKIWANLQCPDAPLQLVEGEEDDKDLITLLLEQADLEEEFLEERDILGTINLFFLAGIDSTSYAISNTLFLIAKHQNVQEQIRREIFDQLGGGVNAPPPTAEQLSKMPYLAASIREALRLLPPTAQMVHRIVAKPVRLPDGRVLSQGVKVVGDIYAMNHNEQVWAQPGTFLPERHLPNYDSSVRSAQDYMSFGYGKRNCIGMKFALVQLRVVVCMLLQKYSIRLVPGAAQELNLPPYFNLHPQNLNLLFEDLPSPSSSSSSGSA